jgi:hypothetical protein
MVTADLSMTFSRIEFEFELAGLFPASENEQLGFNA